MIINYGILTNIMNLGNIWLINLIQIGLLMILVFLFNILNNQL